MTKQSDVVREKDEQIVELSRQNLGLQRQLDKTIAELSSATDHIRSLQADYGNSEQRANLYLWNHRLALAKKIEMDVGVNLLLTELSVKAFKTFREFTEDDDRSSYTNMEKKTIEAALKAMVDVMNNLLDPKPTTEQDQAVVNQLKNL